METKELIKKHIDSKFLSDNGTLQIVSSENYMKVLKENQAKIIEIDRDYVQKFVKIGAYLKSTQRNIFNILERVLKDDFQSNFLDLSEFIGSKLSLVKYIKEVTGLGLKESKDIIDDNYRIIVRDGGLNLDNYSGGVGHYEPILEDLNQHIVSYQNLVFTSFKMIKSLNEDDMITFYEMYEVFDKLGIFDSQWQKSMLEKLGDLTSSLDDVTASLQNVNSTIKDGLDNIGDNLLSIETEIYSGLDTVSMNIQRLDNYS